MNRRTFLIRLGGFAAVAPLLASWASRGAPSGAPDVLSAAAWRTLATVQEHLLPSEPGAPGAREIHAEAYLRGVLADPRLAPAERALLIGGAETLERLARDMTGKHFVELPRDEREAVLRSLEATTAGHRWLGELLGYLMEALLGDPVYGGNPDGIGWRWLAHNPGFPRPPADKRYFLL